MNKKLPKIMRRNPAANAARQISAKTNSPPQLPLNQIKLYE